MTIDGTDGKAAFFMINPQQPNRGEELPVLKPLANGSQDIRYPQQIHGMYCIYEKINCVKIRCPYNNS